MLKKLDQYIIKKFLRTFFFTVLIFTMISVIIDFSEKVENFIDEKDKKNAHLAFIEAQPEMHRSVAKGVFKRNTISRKLSRLSNKIKFLK